MSSLDSRDRGQSKSLPTTDGGTKPAHTDHQKSEEENTSSPSADPLALKVENLPTNKLIGRDQAGRGDAEDENLAQLTLSIKMHNLINPLTVMKTGDEWTVMAGSRRLAAVRQLQWESVPCNIVDDIDMAAGYAITGIENLHRAQLSPMEEAIYCNDAAAVYDDLEAFALSIGRSLSWVTTRLDLLTWPDDCKQALAVGRISRSAIAPLASIADDTNRAFYLAQAQSNGATARQTSAWATEALTQSNNTDLPDSLDTQTAPEDTPARKPPQIPCFLCTLPNDAGDLHHLSVCPSCVSGLHEIRHNMLNPKPDQPEPEAP